MDDLNKVLRKLDEDDFKKMLSAITGDKMSISYMILDTLHKSDLSDQEMIEKLDVNPSAWYTRKSRLSASVAKYLVQHSQGIVSPLALESKKASAYQYGTCRAANIRALKGMEKALLEQELSGELSEVCKTLARLHINSRTEQAHYEMLYKKHADLMFHIRNAEDYFYDFFKKAGEYLVSRTEKDRVAATHARNSLYQIQTKETLQRIVFLYSVVQFYFVILFEMEKEVRDTSLKEAAQLLLISEKISSRYPQNAFYQNNAFLINHMKLEYYTHITHTPEAELYFSKIDETLPCDAKKFEMHFFIARYLELKIRRFIKKNELEKLENSFDTIARWFDADICEPYSYIQSRKYLAVVKYYQAKFSSAAKIINTLRNQLNLRPYKQTDMELKLFQALQYSISGDRQLCFQLQGSVVRLLSNTKEKYPELTLFAQILRVSFRSKHNPENLTKCILSLVNEINNIANRNSPLWYVKSDDLFANRLVKKISQASD